MQKKAFEDLKLRCLDIDATLTYNKNISDMPDEFLGELGVDVLYFTESEEDDLGLNERGEIKLYQN